MRSINQRFTYLLTYLDLTGILSVSYPVQIIRILYHISLVELKSVTHRGDLGDEDASMGVSTAISQCDTSLINHNSRRQNNKDNTMIKNDALITTDKQHSIRTRSGPIKSKPEVLS